MALTLFIILYILILMNSDKQKIQPRFHYKTEGVVLDTQFNTQGTLLGISNENGSIFIYNAPTDTEHKQQNRKIKLQYVNKKNNPILKLAWSIQKPNVLASCSIDKEIGLYEVSQNAIQLVNMIRTQTIPVYITFYTGTENILSTGFSNGKICLYDENLKQIFERQCHEESVNCLNWQNKITNTDKNSWIKEHFAEYSSENITDNPLLVSCSSDNFIKIWKYNKGQIKNIQSFKAHEKQIRQVQWKPMKTQKYIVSCSEDGYVKFWIVKVLNNNKAEVKKKGQRRFGYPVFKAQYSIMGDLIAISYCNGKQQKVQTRIMKEEQGILTQEQNLSI